VLGLCNTQPYLQLRWNHSQYDGVANVWREMLVFERTWELLEITHSMITGDSVHNNAERYDNNQIVIIRLLYNCPSLLASLGLDRFDSFRNLAIKSALCSKMIQQNFGNSAIIITDDFRFDLNSEMCQTL
jgi:hypothetical protein